MEIYEYTGEDFKAVLQFDNWKIGILRYSERFSAHMVDERHIKTDEAFVLLEGNATLFEEEKVWQMEKTKVYNKKGLVASCCSKRRCNSACGRKF